MDLSSIVSTTLLTWLLEPEDPGVRYLTLRDLLDLPASDPELIQARKLAHQRGTINSLLEHMAPEGYWSNPGAGYLPKYFSSVWSIIQLAQLGGKASEDERIQHACSYVLDQTFCPGGQLGVGGTPSSTADCLQGNLCWSLLELGYEDPRLETAFDWMARTVTGDGVAPKSDKQAERRYYAGKCGPRFACGANNSQPCAWGAVKVMLALGKLAPEKRTPLINTAIQEGLDFFFSVDPVTAAWPSGWADKPSGNWWKFGFPVFYITDLLQVAEALVALGYANDVRLASTLEMIRQKQDDQGRWLLEYDYAGKTWIDFGQKKQPNKWVTLRALKVLKKTH